MDELNPKYSELYNSQVQQNERLKELACISATTLILREGKPIEATLQQITLLLADAFQFPAFTAVRISFRKDSFETAGFQESEWRLAQDFTALDNSKGLIEIFYSTDFPAESEGPFLKEERDLIRNIALLVTRYINSYLARSLTLAEKVIHIGEADDKMASSRRMLQKFLDRHNAERDVFHDLMPFMVREILLVANLYDAYSIEGEGRFSDYILGVYYQLSLTSIPRVTGVYGEEEVMSRLEVRHYDMIIIMVGVDKEGPMNLCRKLKDKYPYIPAYLLISNPGVIPFVLNQKSLGVPFDNYFMWTGESKVFFAMVKLLEDKVNVENDTKIGLTSVILIIEDSVEYYSSYLPMLYTLIMEQTKNLIEDVSSDELYKVLKLRARPKILLSSNYEDAVANFNRYKGSLLGVISDMRFPRNGVLNDMAGFDLIKQIRQELPNLPTVLQSSDTENLKYAHILKANFINKNSESLLQDLKSFINYYLGFGHFVYRDTRGRQIAVAKSMKEFESYLRTVPEDSLVYHAMKNHFSLWLMARGEVKIAKIINPIKISDFNTLTELREYLIDIIRKRRRERNKGKVVNFDETLVIDETNVVSLSSGSLGGKGRGLAFVNTLIYSFDLKRLLPEMNIKSPVTAIIGTDEFDMFMDRNRLWDKVKEEKDYKTLQRCFLEGTLSLPLLKKLKTLLTLLKGPLAVRSSSLFEDSTSQPFSGVFGTYLLPNNDPDPDVRLKHLRDAIKLVFASIYSANARTYFEAIGYKVEQEKMAIVIQSVVGHRYGDAFYPHISGTAQSFNFYPVANMTTGDGFAVMAVGLGQYVLEGERAFRFSPAHPALDIIPVKELARSTQRTFYAVDMAKKKIDLLEGENAGLVTLDISQAEHDGNLKHCASVLSSENDTVIPGLDLPGPRIVNFANILKYDYIPLAKTIKAVLDVVMEAFGAPVEIEYAVDLTKDPDGNATFYLLQIKPLVGSIAGYTIEPETVNTEDTLMVTLRSMGNGVINDITDIVYADPALCSNMKTQEMAEEIDNINRKMLHENRKYVLLGPGRWGTRDRFLGIPVKWPQISNAKVIVEYSFPKFHVDASLGSHFFHNVTSMNIGYFSIDQESEEESIAWDKLKKQKLIEKGSFFRHIRFEKPLLIRMDGRKRMAVISMTH